VNQAKDAANRANEANATKSGEADLRAANIASLVQHRDGYNYLMRDVQSMFAYANEKAKNWSPGPGRPPVTIPANGVLNLVYLNTDYIGPAPAGGAPSEGGSQGPTAEFPTIDVVMQISTGVSDPTDARRFLNDTVAQWLRENAKRPDVPYEIVYSTEFLDQASNRPTPGARPGREERDADQRAARGQRGAQPRGGVTEGGSRGGASEGGRGSGGGDGLEDLAPIGPAPDQVPPPSLNRALAFQMVFKPPAPPAEGGDAAGTAADSAPAGNKGGGN
jgi:hypothetical protein